MFATGDEHAPTLHQYDDYCTRGPRRYSRATRAIVTRNDNVRMSLELRTHDSIGKSYHYHHLALRSKYSRLKYGHSAEMGSYGDVMPAVSPRSKRQALQKCL